MLARFGIGRWPAYLAGAAAGFTTVFALQHLSVGFFYWPPLSGAVMIAVTWGLSRQRPELSGVVR